MEYPKQEGAPVFGSKLRKLFGGGEARTLDIEGGPGGLTAADREAVAADLAPLEKAESGLGDAATRYVLSGEDAPLLLRVEALLRGRSGGPGEVVGSVLSSHGAYSRNNKEWERTRAARRRVVIGLEGFDAAAMRRYGELFALHQASTGYRWRFPGSDGVSPLWLRTLAELVESNAEHGRTELGFLSAPRILLMLAEESGDAPPPLRPLLDCCFSNGEPPSYGDLTRHMLQLAGLADALSERPVEAVAAVNALKAPGRAAMLDFLRAESLTDRDPRFFDLAFAAAGDGSRAARDAAIAALAQADETRVREKADASLASRQSGDRLAAVNVLAARFGAAAMPVLAAHEAGGEKSKAVLQAIGTARATFAAVGASADGAGADGAGGYVAFDGAFVEAPPPAMPEAPLPADLEAALRDVVERTAEAARADYDRTPPGKQWNQRPARPFRRPFDPDLSRLVVAAMGGKPLNEAQAVPVANFVQESLDHWMTTARRTLRAGLQAIFARADVSTDALGRLVFLRRGDGNWAGVLCNALGVHAYASCGLDAELKRRFEADADLRGFADAAGAAGQPVAALFAASARYYFQFPERPEAKVNPTVWPVLAANFALVDEAFGGPSGTKRDRGADFALYALRFFPRLPRRYFATVVDRASQGTIRQRSFARWLLRDVGDLTPVIAPMLGAGTEPARIAGARWLAERRDPAAVRPLREALGREKSVGATAAFLAALTACGDDVSDQFSEDKLLADAETGLKKTKADFSALFDAENLPALRWADGRPVPPLVVRWWFVRAHKLKQPGGDPLLHMALERLDRGDAERLGREVLSAFVAHDTTRPTSEAANAHAAAGARQRYEYGRKWRKDYTEELAFAELRREHLAIYLNSALDHRGLLALARFAPPGEATAIAKRYLKDHGKRANQCRALVDALMANPVPAVLQLVLSLSQRHKQPGLRKYAGEVAATYAEERGWLRAELGDRTVPALGLDENGILELPVGERAFRARLDAAKGKKGGEELRLVLENPDGKAITSLPTPSDPEEAAEAKEAKATLASARKELKQTLELQAGRLYEAMCAGRVWPRADFEAYLVGHPVMGRLVRRLVLAGFDAEGRTIASFRALDDGTFTDSDDEPVDIAGFGGIGIAHRATLGEAAAASWKAHLADYEVAPLFEQLDRPMLAGDKPEAARIEDRRGFMIDNYALKNAAEALGYGRGSVEDGAGFYTYEKSFPDSGLVAVIEFSGSYIGESDRVPKYLTNLVFAPIEGRGYSWGETSGVKLSAVPAVLLSEAWNDYHQIAGRGTGFDAEHEKKGGW